MQQRLLQLSGIVFVALVVVSVLVVGSTPGTDEPAADVAAFYDENQVRQFIVSFLFPATVPFLVLFAVGLAERQDEGGTWGRVAVAGAILAGGAILATAAIHFALLSAAEEDDASLTVSALNALDGSTWVAFNAGFGVMMLGAAGVFLTGTVHRWLGWIAVVLGIALFIPVAGFIALLTTLGWIVVTSAVLARRKPAPAHVAAPGTA
jgi:hypothetical protein